MLNTCVSIYRIAVQCTVQLYMIVSFSYTLYNALHSYTHYNIPLVAFVVTLTDTLLFSSFPDIALSAITVIVQVVFGDRPVTLWYVVVVVILCDVPLNSW